VKNILVIGEEYSTYFGKIDAIPLVVTRVFDSPGFGMFLVSLALD
jgi:hypothetical protein